MTKIELAKAVAIAQGTTDVVAKATIESVISIIISEIKAGGEVNLSGLGKFRAVDVPTRTKNIPGTTETVNVPAHRVMRFKVADPAKRTVA